MAAENPQKPFPRTPFESTLDDRLYKATRAYLATFRGFFGTRRSGQYRWREDPKETEIYISDQFPTQDEAEHRPHIFTERAAAQALSLGIGQIEGTSLLTGEKTLSDAISCAMYIHCLSREGVEAQRLAWWVYKVLQRFNASIQAYGQVHLVHPQVTILPQTMSPALSKTFDVTIISPFTIQERTLITPVEESDYHQVVNTIKVLIEEQI